MIPEPPEGSVVRITDVKGIPEIAEKWKGEWRITGWEPPDTWEHLSNNKYVVSVEIATSWERLNEH